MKEKQQKYNLPSGWVWVTIGDITVLSSGGTPSRSNPNYFGGDIPWVKSGELNFNTINDTEEKITNLGLANSSAKIFPAGTLLIALYGATVGKLAFLGIDACTNQAIASISTTDSLDKKYVYYYLRNNREKLLKQRIGGAQPNISQKILNDFPIPLAPLIVQRKIVSKLDELISGLEKSKEQLEISLKQLGIYRQSILKQAFEGKLTEEWRKNQHNSKTSQSIIKSIEKYNITLYKKELNNFNLGIIKFKPKKPKNIIISSETKALAQLELPEDWIFIKLKDICEAVQRVSLKDRNVDDDFIYLDIGGINNKKNIIETYKKFQWKNAPSRAQYIVKESDILFSTVRTYLKKIALIEDEKFDNQIASSGFTVIRIISKYINPRYIFKYIISDSFIRPLNDLQTGSSYPAVRNSDVYDQLVPLCSLEEQEIISADLDRQFSIISHLETTIEKNLSNIDSLKKSLINKAFKGKLLEENLNDTSGQVLLDDIKDEIDRYLIVQKTNNLQKIKIMPEETKSILDILHEKSQPLSAKKLWEDSVFKDDIDGFYAALKKHIEDGEIVELPRESKDIESFLQLSETK